ncbi:MAG: glutathione S-transferase [Deltaproteobacteria bacterium]|nr:MAG: glutathione S-transferase [Deltaproteobacteria bacterium]
MITVHHLEDSRSQRVLWLLEELGVDYEVKRYERDPKTHLAPPELKAVHPLGKSPVITDGDLVVAESGAIMEYLVDRYGGGRLIPPAGSPERLRYTYWMHAAEGTVMPLLVMTLIFDRVESESPWLVRPIAKAISAQVRSSYLEPNLLANLALMQSELERSTWFAGQEMTAADVQMSFPVEAVATRIDLAADYPKLAEFLSRIRARPAYQRALEKGGPYAYGPG